MVACLVVTLGTVGVDVGICCRGSCVLVRLVFRVLVGWCVGWFS